MIGKADWYAEGYKRNIVTYSIAKLIHTIKTRNKVINYGKIWNTQNVNEELENTLMEIGALAVDHITNLAKRRLVLLRIQENRQKVHYVGNISKSTYSLNDEFEDFN